ncbi:NUDIX hydrolase [Rhabdothermincola salaria]|uniref:NUDIX hydrolase n=1 Tax=Rhabdothermincola salaria TaxID=2903142 RepID=UPI001E54452F|nr:hypothetical protein [Rhabdothermincola salaria]MCD9625391.1 hypothetical protein [Rhabdothermincola salaria]
MSLTANRVDVASVPVRDASTLMLVRDADAGLEVCMLRRNLRSDFVGGAYVFPGGGVDDHDRRPEVGAVCCGLDDAAASTRVGVAQGGLAFWVAALRESFEEAGVLLARRRGQRELLRFDEPDVEARFATHRLTVDRGERRLVEICHEEGVDLAVDDLRYVSRWITPVGAPRRYDTRFFVARAPDHQVALHDDREVIANVWVRPADALARHRAGEMEMIFPTLRSLEWLEAHPTAADALAAADAITEISAILPRFTTAPDGELRLLVPGDHGYEDVGPAGGSPRVGVDDMALMARRRAQRSASDERESS